MREILLAIFVLSSMNLIAQDVELSKNQLNINLLPMSISYEGKIDANKSIAISGGFAPTAVYQTGSSGNNSYFFITPYFTGSIRNYYTRKRIKKSNLRNNSGNYVGLFYSHQLKPFGEGESFDEINARKRATNAFVVGPVWGFQRNYASGIHLGLSIGLGIEGGEYIETDASFTGEFQFGFVLFQNK